MPSRPKRPCSFPGCPKLTDGQYCEQHRTQARRQYDRYERSPDINRKYGRAWKRIRDRYASAHPLCEMCLRDSKFTPVDEVHHKLPMDTFRAAVKAKLNATAKPVEAANAASELKVGDKVKMASGAPVYGESYKFRSWVYEKELFVRAINGNRITVSTLSSGAVTGNVERKYLTKVSAASSVKQESYAIYTVAKGDTLWGIAQKTLGSGSRYSEIVKLNGLQSTVIVSGQKLKIPNK